MISISVKFNMIKANMEKGQVKDGSQDLVWATHVRGGKEKIQEHLWDAGWGLKTKVIGDLIIF